MRMRATVKGRSAIWSHLYADTSAELLEFAQFLGLEARWLQRPGTFHEHFDVTDPVRDRAISLGAREITCVETGHLLMQKLLVSRAAA